MQVVVHIDIPRRKRPCEGDCDGEGGDEASEAEPETNGTASGEPEVNSTPCNNCSGSHHRITAETNVRLKFDPRAALLNATRGGGGASAAEAQSNEGHPQSLEQVNASATDAEEDAQRGRALGDGLDGGPGRPCGRSCMDALLKRVDGAVAASDRYLTGLPAGRVGGDGARREPESSSQSLRFFRDPWLQEADDADAEAAEEDEPPEPRRASALLGTHQRLGRRSKKRGVTLVLHIDAIPN